MNGIKKQYAPVGRFENETSHCPLYVAWNILDEVRHYFWAELPEGLDDVLAQRAETVFAKNARWRNKFQGTKGRRYLEMFMRHWLSSALFKRKSPLFHQLPDSFKVGQPLPLAPVRCVRLKKVKAKNTRRSRGFVHGSALLDYWRHS